MSSPTAPTCVVHRQTAVASVAELEDALLGAFLACRDALTAGAPVVVLLVDRDLVGHGSPLDAAAAHGLAGLVRALAVEGARTGWRINALAVSGETDPAAASRWCEWLSGQEDATGVVVRLGDLHLGRIGVT